LRLETCTIILRERLEADMGETIIIFKVEYHWTPEGLIIECPNAAARDFVARSLDDNPITLRLQRKSKDETKNN
jgi:hypothetical protein